MKMNLPPIPTAHHHAIAAAHPSHLTTMFSPQPMAGIETPHNNDVLCGRGVTTNRHKGNEKFRGLVSRNKELYVTSTKKEKMTISRSIVEAVRSRSPPGRFLEKDVNTGLWFDVGDKKAIEKTSQALRDNAAHLRKQLSEDLSDPDFLSAVFEDKEKVLDLNEDDDDGEEKKVMKKKGMKPPKGHRRTQSSPTVSLLSTSRRGSVKRKGSDELSSIDVSKLDVDNNLTCLDRGTTPPLSLDETPSQAEEQENETHRHKRTNSAGSAMPFAGTFPSSATSSPISFRHQQLPPAHHRNLTWDGQFNFQANVPPGSPAFPPRKTSDPKLLSAGQMSPMPFQQPNVQWSPGYNNTNRQSPFFGSSNVQPSADYHADDDRMRGAPLLPSVSRHTQQNHHPSDTPTRTSDSHPSIFAPEPYRPQQQQTPYGVGSAPRPPLAYQHNWASPSPPPSSPGSTRSYSPVVSAPRHHQQPMDQLDSISTPPHPTSLDPPPRTTTSKGKQMEALLKISTPSSSEQTATTTDITVAPSDDDELCVKKEDDSLEGPLSLDDARLSPLPFRENELLDFSSSSSPLIDLHDRIMSLSVPEMDESSTSRGASSK